jgi:uncharacterized protein (TIGR02996 family)
MANGNRRICHKRGQSGDNAFICGTRVPVWTLIALRQWGASEEEVLTAFSSVRQADLLATWQYYERHRGLLDPVIHANDVGGASDGRPPHFHFFSDLLAMSDDGYHGWPVKIRTRSQEGGQWGDAHLNAILENPNDDTPRRMYADFLVEQGFAEQAALIHEMLDNYRDQARRILVRHSAGQVFQMQLRGGFAESVHLSCELRQEFGALLCRQHPLNQRESRDLCSVLRVDLSDKTPHRLSTDPDRANYCWLTWRDEASFAAVASHPAFIPPCLFDRLPPAGWRSDVQVAPYPYELAARHALSEACLSWATRQVTSEGLCKRTARSNATNSEAIQRNGFNRNATKQQAPQ